MWIQGCLQPDPGFSERVIPSAVSEHKFSSLCEQERGTLCFLCAATQGTSPTQALMKARPRPRSSG